MTPRQIELVQQSWRQAEPIADTVVRLFYRRLFASQPELRERFCTSMSEQGDHLLAATHELTASLATEKSQISAGAVDQQTAVIGAWVWAISEETGRLATPEVCEAWTAALRSEAGSTFQLVALGEAALVGV